MPETLTITLTVRSYEMDSFGHVNNAVYLNYLEYARCEYMRQRGLGFADFHKWNTYPYVTRSEIDYKSPAQVDNLLEINGRLVNWTRTGFTIEYDLNNLTTGRLCAQAKMSFAFVNDAGKPVRVPAPFREKMGT
ncbi:MAG TPA: thioesterase family protein [bacterium]|nr:thioesterase family protein [bacterium]HPN45907.1 thioesterase family protein [bacterium]